MFTTTTTTTTTTTPTKPPATKMLKATRHYTIRDSSRRIRTKFPKTQAAIPHHRHYEREEKYEPSTSTSTSTSSTVSSSKTLLAATALAVVLSTMSQVGSAIAGDDDDKKFVRNMLGGCTPDKLDLFKDVRAKFSMEASTGALPEAILDLDKCDYSNIDLDAKVLSGLIARNANFENSQLTHTEMSRTDARGSNFKGVNFKDTNAYSTRFDGSNMENANFENVILSGASFGKYNGEWANMKGANFEGVLLSSSDARELCKNPTLDLEGQMNVGGC